MHIKYILDDEAWTSLFSPQKLQTTWDHLTLAEALRRMPGGWQINQAFWLAKLSKCYFVAQDSAWKNTQEEVNKKRWKWLII